VEFLTEEEEVVRESSILAVVFVVDGDDVDVKIASDIGKCRLQQIIAKIMNRKIILLMLFNF
jgi:hypothetical protein